MARRQNGDYLLTLTISGRKSFLKKRLNFEHPFSQTEFGKPGLAQNVRTSNYGIKQEKAAGLA
jgi:hypothetical protein